MPAEVLPAEVIPAEVVPAEIAIVEFENIEVIKMENWIANDVFDSVDNVAQRYMLVRWAIIGKVKGVFEENTSDNTKRKK